MSNTLGRHILVEFFECEPDRLNEVPLIESSMVEAAKEAGATIINSTFHHFSPYGVSGVVVIQESHLAIHTWPEYGYAAVDLFTCGDMVDPWVAYDYLKKAFGAKQGSAMELKRGQLDLLKRVAKLFKSAEEQKGEEKEDSAESTGLVASSPQFKRSIWFTDKDENTAYSLRHKGDRLFRQKSDYQLVEVYDTYAYGKMLTIDNMVMCTEEDEFCYHEMITHVAMLTHKKAKRVLVIGGGDGGTVRELLRHERLEEVVMVEIDGVVVEAAKAHLPTLAAAFDDPKLKLIIGDGIDYMKQAAAESFDLVIVDSSDPIGPAEGLFSYDFYENVYRVLAQDGILVAQSESPRFNKEAFIECFRCFKAIFGAENVRPYLVFVPTYPSGMWGFSYCCKGGGVHPLDDLEEHSAQAFAEAHDLQYYNALAHKAAFYVPTFVQKMLK